MCFQLPWIVKVLSLIVLLQCGQGNSFSSVDCEISDQVQEKGQQNAGSGHRPMSRCTRLGAGSHGIYQLLQSGTTSSGDSPTDLQSLQ
jgi:hypothetical protein